MKNKSIFLLVFLALSGTASFAQKTLSSQVKPYAANWTYTLVKAMHSAGFDMPTMPASLVMPGAQDLSDPLRLDSTKTFYRYDLNGTPDFAPLFRTRYQYPQPNVRVVIEEQLDNGTWLILNRSTQTSDALGRVVDVFAELYDPATEDFTPDSRLEIYPHGTSQDLVDSFFTYAWNTDLENWQPLLISWNTFNDQDQLLESLNQVLLFDTPLFFRDVYSYDDNGDNHLVEEFALIDGEELPSGRVEITYVDHQPIEALALVFDGAGFVPEKRTNMAYTLFGLLRRQLDFTWDPALETFHLDQTTDLSYDNQQRLAGKETVVSPVNAADERTYIAYAYVEGENLYSEMTLLWDDELFDYILDQKKFYYYSGGTSPADPGPPAVQSLRMAPNPTNGPVRFQLEEEAIVQVFDMSGQQIKSVLLQPDQTIDLSNLPSGIYHLTAQNAQGRYSGKIVKE